MWYTPRLSRQGNARRCSVERFDQFPLHLVEYRDCQRPGALDRLAAVFAQILPLPNLSHKHFTVIELFGANLES